jgi:hypothetical protein
MNKYEDYLLNEDLSMMAVCKKKQTREVATKKGKWSKEEDDLLSELVPIFGGKNWKKISEHIKGRSSIQCLHRWTKILMPGLVKGPWTIEEDRRLIEWVSKEGPNRWSLCADYIKGRSGKQCRERWFNTLNPSVKKGNWEPEEDYKIFVLFKQFGGKWCKITQYFNGRTENSVKNRFYSTLRKIFTEKKKETDIKQNTMSTHLDELMKYFGIALSSCKARLMKARGMSSDELEKYEKMLIESSNDVPLEVLKEKPKESVLSTNGSGSGSNNNPTINLNVNVNNSFICSPLIERRDSANHYKSMDICSLENQILDMCDNSSFLFSDHTPLSFDNHIDNIVDSLFDRNYIGVDDSKPCNLCFDREVVEEPSSNSADDKKEVLNNLFKQLNDIEKAVQMTKKELLKIESSGQDYDMANSLIDSMFKF